MVFGVVIQNCGIVGVPALAGIVLLGGLHLRVALGQDDFDVVKKAADRLIQRRALRVPDFDQWMLGGKTRDSIENQLRSQLLLHVESVNRACELSNAQREKLQLAGDGDLDRLFRAVEQLREEFREVGEDRKKLQTAERKVSALQIKLEGGVFDDSSLFQKVLRLTLDRDQLARYDRQERERRKFHYEGKIELAVANLEVGISLRAEQRQRLIKLLLDETEPPRKFGQYDFEFIFYQAAKLEERKLRTILDEAQWPVFKNVLDQFRGMEATLKSEGYLP